MLMKTVADADGVRLVEMSAEEESAILAEWDANAKKLPAPQPTLIDKILADPQAVADLKAALGLSK